MVKSNDNNGSVPSIAPFLRKCYEMVDDRSTDSIISWSQNSESFVIWNMTEFSVQLLPQHFKHNNFSSFIRQLNIYGFRKTDPDRWEFANDGFIRGQKHLLSNICRKKNLQGLDQQRSVQQPENVVEPCEKIDNSAVLWKEVENLKTDKIALGQELVKLRQYQETADNSLLLLTDRLQGMETNQQQMLSFLVMAMQCPGFLVQLLKPKENNWRVAEPGNSRNMLEEVTETGEPMACDNMIVKYNPPISGTPKPVLKPVADSETQPESDGMKDLFMNFDFVKMLMEENHAPFIPPDLHVDGEWEKLLLDNPFSENIEDTHQDKDGNTSSRMEVEPAVSGADLERLNNFERFLQQMDTPHNVENQSTDNGSHPEKS